MSRSRVPGSRARSDALALCLTASSLLLPALLSRVYAPTILHGIPGGDSGELVAEACELGVAHPPGYPLFIYFAWTAMRVLRPFFSVPAHAVNVACAAASVGAAWALVRTSTTAATLLLRRLGVLLHSTWQLVLLQGICIGAALLYATSPLIWLYSVGAEVFALNNVMVAVLFYIAAVYTDHCTHAAHAATPQARVAFVSRLQRLTQLGALWCGLCLTNQHTSVLAILPLAAWIAYTQWPILTLRAAAATVGAGAVGLLPYVHLPIAHTFWRGAGSWGDTSTLAGFLRHFLRQDYGTFKLYSRSDIVTEGFFARTAAYVHDLVRTQLPPVATALLVCGCLAVLLAAFLRPCDEDAVDSTPRTPAHSSTRAPCKTPARHQYVGTGAVPQATEAGAWSGTLCVARASTFPFALLLCYALYFAVFHSLSNMPLSDPLLRGVHARFWLQPNWLAASLVAMGAAALLLALPERMASAVCGQRSSLRSALRVTISGCLLAALSWGLAGVPARVHTLQDSMTAQAQANVMDAYGAALLQPLPRGAILVTGYDMQWTATRYLQACEGVRLDVALFNAPVMSFSWFAAQRSAYTQRHAGVRFPGTHLVSHLTQPHAAGGFSLADFFAANLMPDGGAALAASYTLDPPHTVFQPRTSHPSDVVPDTWRPGQLFYTGTFLFNDKHHAAAFQLVPFGIVQRVVPVRALRTRGGVKLPSVSSWRELGTKGASSSVRPPGFAAMLHQAESAWSVCARAYNDSSVRGALFDDSTWETATRIDFWSQAAEWGTAWLDAALSPPSPRAGDAMNVTAVLGAAHVLEQVARAQRQLNVTVSANVWKNLGLAYMRLVRDAQPLPRHVSWPLGDSPTPQMSEAEAQAAESAFRLAASSRVLDTWAYYLTLAESQTDASLDTIQHVVQLLTNVVMARSGAQDAGSSSSSVPTRARERGPPHLDV